MEIYSLHPCQSMEEMTMNIIVDTRQQKGKHPEVEDLERKGHNIIWCRMPVGDYCVTTSKFNAMQYIRKKEDAVNKMCHGTDKVSEPIYEDVLGTYSVAVDSKQDMKELASNLLCTSYGKRYRFERELQRAVHLHIRLYIVIADDNFDTFEDLRIYKGIRDRDGYGEAMMEKMTEYQNKYGCRFILCKKNQLADVIEQRLAGEPDRDDAMYM